MMSYWHIRFNQPAYGDNLATGVDECLLFGTDAVDMKKIIGLMFLLSSYASYSQILPDLDIGEKVEQRPGHGSGVHYFSASRPKRNGHPQLVSRLTKKDVKYELVYNGGNSLKLRAVPQNKQPLNLQIKTSSDATKQYLCDLIFFENDDVQVALTHPSKGVFDHSIFGSEWDLHACNACYSSESQGVEVFRQGEGLRGRI